MPHNVQINATTSFKLDTIYFGTEEKPEVIKRNIVANTIHGMFIRSTDSPTYQDVIIDWGDGTFTNLKDGITSDDCYYVTDTENPSEYVYYLKHDYANALSNAGVTFKRFIVKIYGKKYFAIKYIHSTFIDKNGNSITINGPKVCSNLISRVFDNDLPLASHITNLSSFCYGAHRLIHVNNKLNHPVSNLSSTFSSCDNVLSTSGIYKLTKNDTNISNIFASLKFMEYTDLTIPSNTSSIANAFSGCENLNISFKTLLPTSIFSTTSIDVTNAFKYCKLLTNASSELLGKYFWNNKNVTWVGTANTFIYSSDEIRAQVPISWGGTATNDVIIETDSIYDDTEIRNLLQKKADLVSGKVPESQLPDLLKLGETDTTAYSGLAGTQLSNYVMNNLEVRIDDINDDLSNTPQLVSRINSRKIYTKQIYY